MSACCQISPWLISQHSGMSLHSSKKHYLELWHLAAPPSLTAKLATASPNSASNPEEHSCLSRNAPTYSHCPVACHSATWNRCLYEQAKSTSQVEKKAQTCLYSQSPFWQLLQDYRRYTLNTSALVFSTYYRKLKEVQITPLTSLRKKWQDAAACRTTNMLFHSSTDLTAQCQAWEAPCARDHRAVKTTFLLFHSTSPRHNCEFDSAVALFCFIIVLSKISCKPHNQASSCNSAARNSHYKQN